MVSCYVLLHEKLISVHQSWTCQRHLLHIDLDFAANEDIVTHSIHFAERLTLSSVSVNITNASG